MRRYLFLLVLCGLVAPATAQVALRPSPAPPGEESVACKPDRRACVFSDMSGENVYTVDASTFRRTVGSQQAFALTVGGGSTTLLLVAANRARTQIAIVSELASVSTSALFSSGGFAPDAVQRQHRLSIRNPKSGDEIKAIDLGMLRPLAVAMSATGDYVWIAGDEQQLRKRQVRLYNTRSGKQEHLASVDGNATVRLFERGYQVDRSYLALDTGVAGTVVKHNSPNAFSIAEFTVRRSAPLAAADLTDKTIGVVGFQGATADLREMLEGALAIKLVSAGFKVAERQRLKDLLQEARFQNLGLTDSSKAAELGRLLNAEYILFGQLSSSGTMTSIGLRLVTVTDGEVRNGIELECRDCTPDDYLQGLTFLMQDWVQ